MIDEDEIIAAYIRTNYPELLETNSFIVYKAIYPLIVSVTKTFANIFGNLFQIGNKEDENE